MPPPPAATRAAAERADKHSTYNTYGHARSLARRALTSLQTVAIGACSRRRRSSGTTQHSAPQRGLVLIIPLNHHRQYDVRCSLLRILQHDNGAADECPVPTGAKRARKKRVRIDSAQHIRKISELAYDRIHSSGVPTGGRGPCGQQTDSDSWLDTSGYGINGVRQVVGDNCENMVG